MGLQNLSTTEKNERRNRIILYDGYTSHDFVTARVCHYNGSAATSIYRGLTVVPKVESISSSKPSLSDLY